MRLLTKANSKFWDIIAKRGFDNKDKGIKNDIYYSLKEYIEDFHTYSIDINKMEYDNLTKEQELQLNNFLRKTRYSTKRKSLKRLSLQNGVSAMAFTIVNNKVFYNYYLVNTPFKMVGDKVREIYLYEVNDRVNYLNEINTQAYIHYYIKNEVVYKERVVKIQEQYVPLPNEEFSFPWLNEIPVILLPNNESMTGIFKNLETLLSITAEFGANINKEWQYDKSMIELNNFIDGGLSADERQDDIEKGDKRIFQKQDPNSEGINTMSFVSGGGVSSQVAARNYETYKNEVLFYSISWVNMSDGKTNKHGSEVLSGETTTISKLEYMIELMENFINSFLSTLIKFTSQTGELPLFNNSVDTSIKVNYSGVINRILHSAPLPDEAKGVNNGNRQQPSTTSATKE